MLYGLHAKGARSVRSFATSNGDAETDAPSSAGQDRSSILEGYGLGAANGADSPSRIPKPPAEMPPEVVSKKRFLARRNGGREG